MAPSATYGLGIGIRKLLKLTSYIGCLTVDGPGVLPGPGSSVLSITSKVVLPIQIINRSLILVSFSPKDEGRRIYHDASSCFFKRKAFKYLATHQCIHRVDADPQPYRNSIIKNSDYAFEN